MENIKFLVRGPRRHTLITTVADPAYLEDDQIMIQVKAVAPTSADCNMIDHGHKVPYWPFVPGLDGAGVIVAAGSAVSNVATGDRVLGQFAPGEISGAFQSFATLHMGRVAKIPATWSFQEASTIGVSYFTSMLMICLGLKMPLPFVTDGPSEGFSPSSILVVDGYSVVGAAVIQLVRLAAPECKILATATPEHQSHVISLGADAVFDRISATLIEDVKRAAPHELRGVNVVIDTIGAIRTIPDLFQAFTSTGPKKYAQVWTTNSAIQLPDGVDLVNFSAQNIDQLHGNQRIMETLEDIIRHGQYKLPLPIAELGYGFDALERGLELARRGSHHDRLVATL